MTKIPRRFRIIKSSKGACCSNGATILQSLILATYYMPISGIESINLSIANGVYRALPVLLPAYRRYSALRTVFPCRALKVMVKEELQITWGW